MGIRFSFPRLTVDKTILDEFYATVYYDDHRSDFMFDPNSFNVRTDGIDYLLITRVEYQDIVSGYVFYGIACDSVCSRAIRLFVGKE